MFSTRNQTRGAKLALSLAALSTLTGCFTWGTNPKPAPDPVSTEPMVIDEAMQKRDFERSVAMYKSGGIDAGATRMPYAPQTAGEGAGRAMLGPEARNAGLDTVYFVGGALALPFTFFFDYPFAEKNYRGVMYEPSHTLMPVLPPDEAPSQVASAAEAPAPVTEVVPAPADATTPAESDTTAPGAVQPGETPPEAQPPVIKPEPEPESSEPAPEKTETTEPAPEATEPAPEKPAPEAAEPAPTEPAPEANK